MKTDPLPRARDADYNNPSRASPEVRPLSEAERVAFESAEAESLFAPDDFPVTLAETRGAIGRVFVWGRGLVAFGLLGLVLLALVAYVAALDFYVRLESLPLVWQIPFWVLLVLFVGLLIHTGWQGGRLWWRLRRSPQIVLPKPLADTTVASDAEARSARASLVPYLESFRQDRERLTVQWRVVWPNKAKTTPEEVVARAVALLDPGPVESGPWLEDFERSVVMPLREVAEARIWHYTKLISIKTAISPYPLIDVLAVLYNSARMLQDIALIFNRRMERGQAALLLGAVVFQTFVASQAQEILESGAEELSGFLSNSMARASGKLIGARIAEGTVNGLVARRIGIRALRYLLPVRHG